MKTAFIIMISSIIEFIKLYIVVFKIFNIPKREYLNVVAVCAAVAFINVGFYIIGLPTKVTDGYILVISIILANCMLTKKKRHIVLVLVAFMIITVLDMALAGTIAYMFKINLGEISSLSLVGQLLNTPGLIIVILLAVYAHLSHKQSIQTLTNSDFFIKYLIIILIGVFFFSLYLSTLMGINNNNSMQEQQKSAITSGWISGLTFFVICAFNLVFANISDRKTRENLLYKSMLDKQKEHYELLLNAENNTRKFRHDVSNHFSCVVGLLDEGKVDEAKNYLEEINGEISRDRYKAKTGNTIVDIVIKDLFAGREDICLKVKGGMPSNISITQMDMCILFSNLLKNAIEAVDKSQDKVIDLEINNINGGIFINISNCYSGDIHFKNGIPITTKNKSHNGFGSQNIQNVVEKYDGTLKYKTENDKFIVEILLPDVIK